MAHIGKRLKKAYEGIDPTTLYGVAEAVKLVKTRAQTQVDETVEIAKKLNADPRNAVPKLGGAVPLPDGDGARGEGRAGRVPRREGGSRPRWDRQGQLYRGGAHRERARVRRRDQPGEALGRQGHVHQEGQPEFDDGARPQIRDFEHRRLT